MDVSAFSFFAKHATMTVKPGEGPYERAFIADETSITLSIENGRISDQYKSTFHAVFDGDGRMQYAYFCKGEPFNFDNWSSIEPL